MGARATQNEPPGPLEVLFEDNHLLCVYKPSGLLSQSGPEGAPDLLSLCREYVRERYNKPGAVYLGLVHRLDWGTSGPMVFARTSKAAARLSEQFRSREIAKDYQALVTGRPAPPAGELRDFLIKEERMRLARIVPPETRGAREALLSYQTRGTRLVSKRRLNELLFPEPSDSEHAEHPETKLHEVSLVDVELLTGRFHQIRCQLAHRGHPILGDAKYHSRFALRGQRLALECVRLEFEHPVKSEAIVLAGRALLQQAFERIPVAGE